MQVNFNEKNCNDLHEEDTLWKELNDMLLSFDNQLQRVQLI